MSKGQDWKNLRNAIKEIAVLRADVARAKESRDTHAIAANVLREENSSLRAENERLREAVEEIARADPDYIKGEETWEHSRRQGRIMYDAINRARAALAKGGEGQG